MAISKWNKKKLIKREKLEKICNKLLVRVILVCPWKWHLLLQPSSTFCSLRLDCEQMWSKPSLHLKHQRTDEAAVRERKPWPTLATFKPIQHALTKFDLEHYAAFVVFCRDILAAWWIPQKPWDFGIDNLQWVGHCEIKEAWLDGHLELFIGAYLMFKWFMHYLLF